MNNLEQIIRDEVEKISKKHHLPHQFEIIVTTDEDISTYKGNLVDIKLEAGNPPKMIFPMIFVGRCFLAEKPNLILFRDRVVRALEKYPRMLITLSHNIPRNLSLILVKDLYKWNKTQQLEQYEPDYWIPPEDLEITYSATVRDKITGVAFTDFDSDAKKAREKAFTRVFNVLRNNEEMQRFKDLAKALTEPVSVPPIQDQATTILIQTQVIKDEHKVTEQLNEERRYES